MKVANLKSKTWAKHSEVGVASSGVIWQNVKGLVGGGTCETRSTLTGFCSVQDDSSRGGRWRGDSKPLVNHDQYACAIWQMASSRLFEVLDLGLHVLIM